MKWKPVTVIWMEALVPVGSVEIISLTSEVEVESHSLTIMSEYCHVYPSSSSMRCISCNLSSLLVVPQKRVSTPFHISFDLSALLPSSN